MTTAQKLHIETVKFIGNNVISVSGNDIAKFYTMIFTTDSFATKVESVYKKLGANTLVEGNKLTILWKN